ncbi:MAG TPA: archaetidylserine decarboxylase [Gammaproteobacteria bacterium]|nr:archaetidylserine decarboxylase [Gammaproteobacteria bacterium]
MSKPLYVLAQYCCPQRAFTHFFGWLAKCRWKWFKNWAIKRLIRKYHVNLSEALSENVDDYPDFNSFFTRQLKPSVRPLAPGENTVSSPADGSVSQIGKINKNAILQAKNFNYTTRALLGGSESAAQLFEDGNFATIYLAPKDYHRVHMPITGKLRETTFIPGQLFSVNPITAETVPNLFARNERLVCLFDTVIGPVAVILVGAMLVGSIETVWGLPHPKNKLTARQYPDGIVLERGDELGLFKMGSTVIMLFPAGKIEWLETFKENSSVRIREAIGEMN